MIEGMKCDGEQNKCLINFCVVQYDCFDGGFVIVWGVIFYLRVYGVLCYQEQIRIRYIDEDFYLIVRLFFDVICIVFVLVEMIIDYVKEIFWISILRQIL